MFCFFFFGHEASGTLAPPPGIEPTPPALEDEVLTTRLPRKSCFNILLFFILLLLGHKMIFSENGFLSCGTGFGLGSVCLWQRVLHSVWACRWGIIALTTEPKDKLGVASGSGLLSMYRSEGIRVLSLQYCNSCIISVLSILLSKIHSYFSQFISSRVPNSIIFQVYWDLQDLISTTFSLCLTHLPSLASWIRNSQPCLGQSW